MSTTVSNWIRLTQRLLADLRQIDIGYPLGDNVIHSPAAPRNLESLTAGMPTGVRQQLKEFYGQCSGLSWPDVGNGLFIESSDRLLTNQERDEPNELLVRGSSKTAKILVLGTDGGGGRFCIDRVTGKIIHVVTGTLSANRLEAESNQVSIVAEDLNGFLSRLQADLRAFINDDREHQYLA
ncbi:MAG TPA: SMI1/KNR4 family protein [Verrucomicrobiae bacterium]|nr:SMI1/KNR4 family protein [Verrucomicrobiae bacterium]